MDTTQFLLTIVLSITTVLLIIIGIQLIFVLREVRKALKKVNHIVEGVEKLGLSVEQGVGEFKGFLTGIKAISKIVDLIHAKKNARSK